MISAQLAQEANRRLGSAIATLLDDAMPLTVRVHVEGAQDREGVLRQVGEDITVLARAMQILTRRSEGESSHGV